MLNNDKETTAYVTVDDIVQEVERRVRVKYDYMTTLISILAFMLSLSKAVEKVSEVYAHSYIAWFVHVLPVFVVFTMFFYVLKHLGLFHYTFYYRDWLAHHFTEKVLKETEEPVYFKLTELQQSGRLIKDGQAITDNHFNSKMVPNKYTWIVRGPNNSKLATLADLQKAGYEVTEPTTL